MDWVFATEGDRLFSMWNSSGEKGIHQGTTECLVLPAEHSAILLTCIKLPLVIKIFVLSIFEWPFYTGFTAKSTHPYATLQNR